MTHATVAWVIGAAALVLLGGVVWGLHKQDDER